MKLNYLIVVLYLFVTSSAFSASISFDSLGSQWEDGSGSPLSDGNIVLIGNFDTSGVFDFSSIGTSEYDSYNEVSSFFTQYGLDTTETEFGASGVQQGGTGPSSDTGSAIYFWAFNSSDVSLATEWAIVSNTDLSWFVPSDSPIPGSTSIDIGGLADTRSIEFGNLSSNLGIGDQLNIQTALLVPEPSTYALFAGVLAFGYIVIRRSRSQA
ncbi:MAG: hypothetical protein ACJAUA_000632 [Zhongshania aliphaticivorans]|jgi:hypothetical protein